jgi:hypothetical protein
MSQSQRSINSKRSSKSGKSKQSKTSRSSKAKHNFKGGEQLNPELEENNIDDANLNVLLGAHVKKAKAGNSRLSNSIMSKSSRSPLKTSKRPLTYPEMRERERIAESANMGPGAHDGHLIPFGSDVHHKISMGSKYEFKPDKNPGAGTYDTTAAMKHVKPRAYEAMIIGQDKKE